MKSVVNVLSLAMVFVIAASASLSAADNNMSVELNGSGGLTVKVDGQPLAAYIVDQGNKPYLWPVTGPTGKPMTRAYPMQSVAGEQHDHPHHRSIWFGHEVVNGFDTWHEAATFEKPLNAARLAKLGATVHRQYLKVAAGGSKAVIITSDDYLDPDKKKVMDDVRRMTFWVDGETRVIDFDIEFTAGSEPVTFGDAKDAGFSVRVPSSMAVDTKAGGRIVNSEGTTNESAWGQRAKWCDYHGPVEGETVGIAILNHPSSFRHPTPWHVRTYGLFTANPFGMQSLDKSLPDGKHTLQPGEKLTLRHRIVFHAGDEKVGHIAEAYERYAAETLPAVGGE
jgi:hypothetical protein